jgi:hypothetical protein
VYGDEEETILIKKVFIKIRMVSDRVHKGLWRSGLGYFKWHCCDWSFDERGVLR